jgi:hypothetical protein
MGDSLSETGQVALEELCDRIEDTVLATCDSRRLDVDLARDNLRGMLAALCDDNDRLRAQLSAIAEEGTRELNAAVDLRRKLAEARALLLEYGRHTRACDDAINRSEFPESEPCVCGWAEAEKTLEGKA